MTGRAHILSVDDNMTNQKILEEYLSLHGFNVSLAMHGKEAIDFLDTGDYPDLILMDLLMPEMDGFEATQKIRSREDTRDIPIIAVSASLNDETVERALTSGCNEFFSKPVDYQHLIERINHFIVH